VHPYYEIHPFDFSNLFLKHPAEAMTKISSPEEAMNECIGGIHKPKAPKAPKRCPLAHQPAPAFPQASAKPGPFPAMFPCSPWHAVQLTNLVPERPFETTDRASLHSLTTLPAPVPPNPTQQQQQRTLSSPLLPQSLAPASPSVSRTSLKIVIDPLLVEVDRSIS